MIRFHIFAPRLTRALLLPAVIGSLLFTCSGCGDLVVMTGQLLSEHSAADGESAVSADPESAAEPGASLSGIDAQAAAQRSDYEATQTPLYEEYSYFIPELSEAERSNFTALYQGILAFQESIPLPVPASSEEVKDLMSILSTECPELLQLGSTWSQRSNLLDSVTMVSPSYIMDQETYRTKRGAVETLLTQFHTQLDGSGIYQTELALFNYIIEHCVYSTEAQDCQNAYGALIDGQAKCDGRAKALVWCLRSFGITSSVITGSNHAWVLAKIEGYHYNVDPTYDDNEIDGVQYPCSYAHFNVPEASIADNPYPADELFVRRGYPATVHWDGNYHVRSGLWVPAGQSGQELFLSLLSAAAQAGHGLINLRFESAQDLALASASYPDWIQTFLNETGTGCNITSYDCSDRNILFLELSFQ